MLAILFEDTRITSSGICLRRKMVSAVPSLALSELKYTALLLLNGRLPSSHSGIKRQRVTLSSTKNCQLYSKKNYPYV